MKKIQSLLVVFLIFSSVTFGWDIIDGMNVHEPINEATVKYFVERIMSGSQKYKLSKLDAALKFAGISWHAGTKISILQSNLGVSRTETFQSWVGIGGVDADVDSVDSETITVEYFGSKTFTFEKPLRHFYDPEIEPRYLTDFTPWALKQGIKNPKMDHVKWALHEKTHHWSFDQGLMLYKAAMEMGDGDVLLPELIGNYDGYFNSDTSGAGQANRVTGKANKEKLFGAAFRSLGETLHAIGDLCVPAHVRNDSHGGPSEAGGKDPIESSIGFETTTKILEGIIQPPSQAADFLNRGKSVEELLVACAKFTNNNFYSNDTINNSNPSVTPNNLSDSKKAYTDPQFSKSDLVDKDNSKFLVKTFSNVPVVIIELTHSSYLGLFPKDTFHVPFSAAEDQARVLHHLAVGAGAEVIDRFFPTMKLALTLSETGRNGNQTLFSVNGTFVHQIENDPTWANTGVIKYNGEGDLLVNDVSVATTTFVDGVMTTLTNREFNNNDKVQLRVRAGALIHISEVVPVSTTQENSKPYKLDLDKGLRFDTGKPEIVSLSGTTDDGTLGIFNYLSQVQVGNYQYRRLERGETMIKYGGSVADLKTATEAPAYDSTYKYFSSQTKNGALAANDLFYFYLRPLNQYGAIRIETVTDSSVTFYLKYGSVANNRTLDTYASGNGP